MHRFSDPPHLNLRVYDPHYPYGPNVLSAPDPLAIPLHTRASYERACAIFGVAPKSDAEIMDHAALFEYEEFPPGAWAACGRNGRVALRLDSAYYFETLRERLAEQEWRREYAELGRGVQRRPDWRPGQTGRSA